MRISLIASTVVLAVTSHVSHARAHERLMLDVETGEYRCEAAGGCGGDDECNAPDVCAAPPGDPVPICHRPGREVWCCTLDDHECPDGTCVPVSSSGPGASPGSVCVPADLEPFCGMVVGGEIPRTVVDQCFQVDGSGVPRWNDGDCDGDGTPNEREGLCPCVSCESATDAGTPAMDAGSPRPRPPANFEFRGAGGCVCGASGMPASHRTWWVVALAPLALAARRRRRG